MEKRAFQSARTYRAVSLWTCLVMGVPPIVLGLYVLRVAHTASGPGSQLFGGLISLSLIALGLYILKTHESVVIDPERKRWLRCEGVFPLRRFTTGSLEELRQVTFSMEERRTSKTTTFHYIVAITSQKGITLRLADCTNRLEAWRTAEEAAGGLGLRLVDKTLKAGKGVSPSELDSPLRVRIEKHGNPKVERPTHLLSAIDDGLRGISFKTPMAVEKQKTELQLLSGVMFLLYAGVAAFIYFGFYRDAQEEVDILLTVFMVCVPHAFLLIGIFCLLTVHGHDEVSVDAAGVRHTAHYGPFPLTKYLPTEEIEDVEVRSTDDGDCLTVRSDRRMLQFSSEASEAEKLWLAYRIRSILTGK